MNSSSDIQAAVIDFARSHGFTAPYGVLDSEQVDKSGKKYKSVTFGYVRTHDFEVRIYNRGFMLVRNSAVGNTVFKNPIEMLTHLKTL